MFTLLQTLFDRLPLIQMTGLDDSVLIPELYFVFTLVFVQYIYPLRCAYLWKSVHFKEKGHWYGDLLLDVLLLIVGVVSYEAERLLVGHNFYDAMTLPYMQYEAIGTSISLVGLASICLVVSLTWKFFRRAGKYFELTQIVLFDMIVIALGVCLFGYYMFPVTVLAYIAVYIIGIFVGNKNRSESLVETA